MKRPTSSIRARQPRWARWALTGVVLTGIAIVVVLLKSEDATKAWLYPPGTWLGE